MNNLHTTDLAAHHSLMLTPDDVDRLLKDGSPESRSVVLEKVAAHYNASALTEREGEIAEQIFRLLMRDMSLRVRETLAERVKQNPTVPRDIILHLAHDVETVATPVLAESTVLSDADLVSVVEASRDMGKLLAISQRPQVSPRVSDALVETHYARVMTSLLQNDGAQISEQSLNRIVDEFADEQEVMDALVGHPKLPLTFVEQLVRKASTAIAAQLKARYQLSDAVVEKDANKVRDDFMLRLLDADVTQEEIEALVARMAEEGSLNASILMTALCRGQTLFFTVALARIASVPVENARRLIADRGELGFSGIYKKSGLPESMADAVRLLLRAVQAVAGERVLPGTKLYANRLVEQILQDAGDQNIEYLPYILALIRQNVYRK